MSQQSSDSDSEVDNEFLPHQKSEKLLELEQQLNKFKKQEFNVNKLDIKIVRKKVTAYCDNNGLTLKEFRINKLGADSKSSCKSFDKFMTFNYTKPKSSGWWGVPAAPYHKNECYMLSCHFFRQLEIQKEYEARKKKVQDLRAKEKAKLVKDVEKEKKKEEIATKKKADKLAKDQAKEETKSAKKRKPQDEGGKSKSKNAKVVD